MSLLEMKIKLRLCVLLGASFATFGQRRTWAKEDVIAILGTVGSAKRRHGHEMELRETWPYAIPGALFDDR